MDLNEIRRRVDDALKAGDDCAICAACADAAGAVWPSGHVASFWVAACGICNTNVSVCALSDYNWPQRDAGKLDREL